MCLVHLIDERTAQRPSSAVPTGLNQNRGLTSRNRLDMTLEYWDTESYPDAWCYSPSGPAPFKPGPNVAKCLNLSVNKNDPYQPQRYPRPIFLCRFPAGRCWIGQDRQQSA